MPSLLSHVAIGLAAGVSLSKTYSESSFIWLSIVASSFPDIDAISFVFNIPYKSLFGHRGFFHSICFAFILSILILEIGFPELSPFSKRWLLYGSNFFLICLSHAVLDAMTEGGMGVAFFSPFSQKRYLFPWRPLIACPLTVEDFFSEWGKIVIKSELVWIWLPSFFITLFIWFI